MRFMVAFSSPKRSAKAVEIAASHAQALGAEVVLARVIPNAEKVGVVAQLISTEQPKEKAQQQIDTTVAELKARGINASGIVRVGEVASGIVDIAKELGADLLFVGTENFHQAPAFFMARDPIVHYLVDHCPISLVLIRHAEAFECAQTD